MNIQLYENKVNYLDRVWFPKESFVIIASSVLVLHGLIERNNDLDIIVSDSLIGTIALSEDFNEVVRDGDIYYQSRDKIIEIAYKPKNIIESFSEAYINSIESENGYHFMSIESTIAMYKMLDRVKDKEKIQMLEMVQSIDVQKIREEAIGNNLINHIKRGI